MEQRLESTGLGVSIRGLNALHSTRRWATILGIMLVVGIIVSMVLAILAGTARRAFLMPYPLPLAIQIFYVAIVALNFLLYVPFCVFVFQYRGRLATALRTGDGAALERALWAQRRFWTLGGVIVIVWVAVFVLTFVGAIVVAIVSAAHRV